jgi:hypothetical protein
MSQLTQIQPQVRLQLGDLPLFRHRLSRLDVRGGRRVRNRMFPMSGAR